VVVEVEQGFADGARQRPPLEELGPLERFVVRVAGLVSP
jgi:hypothetical protein